MSRMRRAVLNPFVRSARSCKWCWIIFWVFGPEVSAHTISALGSPSRTGVCVTVDVQEWSLPNPHYSQGGAIQQRVAPKT